MNWYCIKTQNACERQRVVRSLTKLTTGGHVSVGHLSRLPESSSLGEGEGVVDETTGHPWIWLVLAILCAIPSTIAHAQSATPVTATVDRNEVQIADPFTLRLNLNAPAGTQVTFPRVTDSLGPFQVISHNDIFDVPMESGRSWTRVYELESYESGHLRIPSMTILVGQEQTATTPINVTVQSLLEESSDPTKFRELKDVEEIPVNRRSILPWVIGLSLVTILLIVMAWFALSHRNKGTKPERWALAQLDELQSSANKDQTIVLPLAANILREYIRRRFQIAAPTQTTDEFLARIQYDPCLDSDQRQELQGFLRQIDQIKFAHLVPATDQLSETLQRVRQFVHRTSQQVSHESSDNPSEVV